MRLWSLHPRYLDAKGLVALWREGLLAQKVLQGKTKGYRHHPQLKRFRDSGNPARTIAGYLKCVADEADSRGYNFDRQKITAPISREKMTVTSGQLKYEWAHLMAKLEKRDPQRHARWNMVKRIDPHPLFEKIRGAVEDWEVV
jgi:hypothetical protein